MWLSMWSISIGANSVYLNSPFALWLLNPSNGITIYTFFFMATRMQIKVKGITVNSESRQIKAAKHTKCV